MLEFEFRRHSEKESTNKFLGFISLSKTIVFRNVPISICLSVIKQIVVESKEWHNSATLNL